ncbi:hypothetical protein, partial [Escherichia fergusonii]|uniref:hypothetical protein n=1 Tax=Escherichia fergusonii TaxID=564 RepID=UPI001CBB15D2
LAYTPGETIVAALSSRLGQARMSLHAVAQSVDAPAPGPAAGPGAAPASTPISTPASAPASAPHGPAAAALHAGRAAAAPAP